MKKRKRDSGSNLSRDFRGLVTLTHNPIWRAMAKKPVSKDIQATVGLAARKALYAMSNDFGELEHLGELILTANTAYVLAEAGYGDDCISEFQSALSALENSKLLFSIDNKCTLNKSEVACISEMVRLYEEQVSLVAQDVLTHAIVEAYRRTND